MRAKPWLAAVLATLLLAPSLAAQTPDIAPPAEVDDSDIPGLVDPLGEPGQATLTVSVGCEAQEAPTTDTLVELRPASTPGWMNVIVSPSTLAWKTGPGDCPSTGMPFTADTTVSVSTTQDAPAYEETGFPIEATVVKKPPDGTEERSYGPYIGNVSLTPGYFHSHNVRVPEKVKQARPGQTLTYEADVESFANHDTAYRLQVLEEHEDHEIRHEPEQLVLAPNETGTFTIEVASLEGAASSSTVSVEMRVQGDSTHPLGGETGTSQVSVLAKFTPPVEDPRDALPVPGPGPLLAAAVVALAALVRRRVEA